VLTYVARGEADAGIAYATDAHQAANVRIAYVISEDLHTPIRYPLAILKPAHNPQVEALAAFLRSPAAMERFRQHGFQTAFAAAETATAVPARSPTQTPSGGLGLTAADWNALRLSVVITFAGVAASLPFGIALGWLLARKSFVGKTALETAVNLPLVLPPVVTGYLLLLLLGRKGWIGSRLETWFGVEVALTWKAAVLAVAVMGFPLLVRAIRLAFQQIDPRLFQAARSLGARPFDAFWTVSLPLARNGVIAGALLAFARGLGEFGATLIFAGNREETRTLALQFYNTLEGQSGPDVDRRLALLILASFLLAAGALGISEWLERRGRHRVSA
jgi:molybdate transport system permease protein